MHDILLTLAAAAGPLIGLGIGYLAGLRRGHGPRPVQAICGCKHSLAMHDPQRGTCSATVGDWHWEEMWDPAAEELVNRRVWKTCACRQYVGPRPIESLFAPTMLPPADPS